MESLNRCQPGKRLRWATLGDYQPEKSGQDYRPAASRPSGIAIVVLVVALMVSAPAHAASLSLFTDAPPASPLVITPLDSTDRLLVQVVNNTAADPPSEFLTGWQVELHIAPDSGATGSLGFASAGKPADYLFDGVGHPGPSISNSGNELFAFDFNFPASGGVQVPVAPGANLLSVAFNPSANAYGTFGIYARGDPTTSEWSDAAMPVQQRRRFANLPQTGGSVRIADVLVTSPATTTTTARSTQPTTSCGATHSAKWALA